MNVGLVHAPASGLAEPPAGPDRAAFERAARDRELAEAVRALNENAVAGPGSELRFSVDRQTGRSLIQVVDRATNQVVNQIPPEQVIRLAAYMLRSERLARLA